MLILFNSASESQKMADDWMIDYNEFKPHDLYNLLHQKDTSVIWGAKICIQSFNHV